MKKKEKKEIKIQIMVPIEMVERLKVIQKRHGLLWTKFLNNIFDYYLQREGNVK